MSSKEQRYRLLLELYPSDFRREYADEMIGVLMADPRPVRKHAASLLSGAVAARLRQTLDGPEWRRAALTVQLFGAILLCALALRRLAMTGQMMVSYPSSVWPPFDMIDVIRVVAWGTVVAAAFAAMRGLAVPAALVGLGCEIAAPARTYLDTPAVVLHVFWLIVTAAVVLIASAVSRGPRPRGLVLVTAAGLGLIVQAFINPFTGFNFYIFRGTLLVSIALVGAGVVRLEPMVRRRVIACAVPVLAAFPLVQGFSGFVRHNQLHPEDLWLIGPGQWVALVTVPALAFWVAAGLNMRLERTRAAVSAAVAVSAGVGPEK
jgi:hypothetical protein